MKRQEGNQRMHWWRLLVCRMMSGKEHIIYYYQTFRFRYSRYGAIHHTVLWLVVKIENEWSENIVRWQHWFSHSPLIGPIFRLSSREGVDGLTSFVITVNKQSRISFVHSFHAIFSSNLEKITFFRKEVTKFYIFEQSVHFCEPSETVIKSKWIENA